MIWLQIKQFREMFWKHVYSKMFIFHVKMQLNNKIAQWKDGKDCKKLSFI